MAQILKLRRSAIAGAKPTTAQIEFGEVAMNTADGKLFMKVSGSGGDSVIEIGANASGSASGNISGSIYYIPVFTGANSVGTSSIYQSGSFTSISGSLSITNGITGSLFGTASWARNATTASYALNAVSTSFASTASYVNPLNQQVIITGSLIQGLGNIATGENSHAEGDSTQAIGLFSHAEGLGTIAYGGRSHAEGQDTIASGSYSHAEGNQTIALADHQHVQGQYNAVSSAPAAFIVGNGIDSENRSNLIHAAGNEVEITGSLNVSGSITGSLFGTSSWAQNALTASSADNFTVRGTLTAQTIVVQTITSSVEFVTGSTHFGTIIQNTHEFTGSLSISGSLVINGTSYTAATSGTSGTSGTAGSSGTSGTSGSSGSSGSTGSSGTSGTAGSSGSTGTSGTAGSSGSSGSTGTSGTSGSSGSAGTSGTSGTSGSSGISGSSGSTGTSGSSGSSGSSGTSGTSGTSGSTGTSGTSGSGTSGTSGVNGTSGTSGTSGINGVSTNLFLYEADANTFSGAPSSGHILWNNATQISATQININHLTDTPIIDIDIFLSLLQTGQKLTIQDRNNSANYQIWTISNTPTYVSPTYWTIPVTLVSSAGTGTTGFANNHQIFVATSVVSGTSGSSGTAGTSGTSGSTGTSGTSGSSGSSGSTGTSGTAGTSGQTGSTGSSGTAGTSGTGFNTINSPAIGRVLVADASNNAATASAVLIVSSSNVGIGTTTPNAKLDVNGSAIVSGSLTVTQGITGSLFGTASFAVSASWAPGGSSTMTIADEGVVQGTATFLNFIGAGVTATVSANTGSITITSGTSGGGSGLTTKAGSVANSSFTGTPNKATVTFTTAFPDTNYAVTITGEDARSWTIESKVSGSFIINSNSNVAPTGTTYWTAVAYGEGGSVDELQVALISQVFG